MRILLLLVLTAAPLCAAQTLSYTVHSDVAAGRFSVQVCTDVARERLVLRGGRTAAEFVVVEGTDAFRREGRRLVAEGLQAGECQGYGVDAVAAAAQEEDGVGHVVGDGAWLLAPRVWLWRPRGEALRLRFVPAAGQQVSVPWAAADDGWVDVAAGSALGPAWAAFGAVDPRALRVDGRQLRIATVGVADAGRRAQLHAWLRGVARSTLSVHGALPLPDAQVLVMQVDSNGSDPVPWGQSARGGGVAVHLYVRKSAQIDALRADWVAAHEFAHLFHPYLGDRGRWLSEGLASYYQNVLRARSGALDEAEAWRRLHAGFGRGRRDRHALPLEDVSAQMRRLGANMRTYWSGAALWLRADVELRRRGSSLDAVLGRFAGCCLPARGRWTPERFVAALDRQVEGQPVFAPLYRQLAHSQRFPSLQQVYALLGLRARERGLVFDDSASAARLRAAIMQGP